MNNKIYTYNEVFDSTLNYFNGDDLATNVWITKYCKSELTDDGSIIYYEKNPDDMFHRIASEIARAGMKYNNPLSENEVYDLIKEYKYILFAGRPMAGIGVNDAVSISNCFVVGRPGQDSYGTIATIDQEIMQISKRGGGIGVDLSDFRPNGSKVNNAARTSSGPVNICATRFSNTIREVGQNGRRGALMLSMDINHPSVEEFIDAKMEDGKITGANISVKLFDDWLKSALGIDCEMDMDKNRIWKKIVHNATTKAEPGILFWDSIIRESVADCYKEFGYETTSTNPCIVGETMVAVADGRGYVSIKDLADKGDDVPVYCLDDNRELAVRIMRNPRYTGHKEVYEITLENGHKIKCTGNHKILVNNVGYVEAQNLKIGDSLYLMNKFECNWKDVHNTKRNDRLKDYLFINHTNNSKLIPEHRIIYDFNNPLNDAQIVHHIDFNSQNNSPDNLQGMTAKEHNYYHSELKKGKNNPIFKVLSDEILAERYKINMSKATSGLKNGRAYNITCEEYLEHGIKFTKQLKRQFTKLEWDEYIRKNNLPMLTDFRQKTLGNFSSFAEKCAKEINIDYINEDARIVRNYYKALANGYDAFIDNGVVMVKVKCEWCGKIFIEPFKRRETKFCSSTCSNLYVNANTDTNTKRTDSINDYYYKLGEKNKIKLIETYNELKNSISTPLLLKDFERICKERNIPHRFKTKYGFNNYAELKLAAGSYNHKIIDIKIVGYEDVYNGTVDDYHNFFIGKFEEVSEFGKPKFLSINNRNCGELPLCPEDSCRLMAINLYSYVDNPFSDNAKFNYDKFINHSKKCMKIMDNMIELELEKIDKILAKIESDPEDEDIKAIEKNLWIRVRKKCEEGRRSGIGITAEGDMLAALGIKYGTKKATEFVGDIHRILATAVYIESCDLVQRDNRPCFSVFDYNLEKNNPFLYRLANEFTYGNEAQNYIEALSAEFKAKWINNLGRRNIACLTIAPTGSLSTQTRTTSGVEPVFMISYRRRRKIDKGSGIIPDFIDKTGDAFIEFNVVHHKFIVWYSVYMNISFDEAKAKLEKMNDKELQEVISKSPYYNATAMDCDWHERVNMQGTIQKYVDHSISVTVNLPRGTSEDIVEDVYKTAWLAGCKGSTIYVDGSRDGVLISKDDESSKKKCNCNEIIEANAPKRPKKLPCKIVRFSNKGDKWIAAVGLYESKPYEIFSGLSEKLNIPNSIEEGYIVRNKIDKTIFDDDEGVEKTIKVSRYDFEYENSKGETIIVEGLSTIFNEEFWNYGKLISGLLRHGMPINYVIKVISTLDFGKETINSWKNGIIRTLKTFTKDEDLHEPCPKCGGHLRRESGCIQCMDCGWSKCGAN